MLWISTQAPCDPSCLQTLVRELLEAERQSAQVRQAHLQNVEELRTQQEKQLTHAQQLRDANMQELLSGVSLDRSVRLTAPPAGQSQICGTEPSSGPQGHCGTCRRPVQAYN